MARRAVAWCSWAAAGVLLAHGVLWDAVRHDHGGFIARPADLVAVGTGKASLFRLALVTDMLQYLLFIPAVAYLWRALRTRRELLVDVISAAGLMFAVVGAVAAAVLATAGEPLIRRYAHAGSGKADEIAVVFGALIDAVTGVWQMAGGILLGVWLVGLGMLLRAQWPWFARFSLVLGVVALVAAAGRIVGLEYESGGPATLAFLPLAVWIGWLGVLLWARSDGESVSPDQISV